MDSKLIMSLILIGVIALIKWNSPNIYYEQVQGGSMEPYIKDNQIIKIQEITSPEEIMVDDVIIFETDLGLYSHRVIEINKDSDGIFFITKGDSNTRADSYYLSNESYKLRFNQIKGKYVG